METTEVIICGCGPTGALLASRLGQLGVKNVCIEKVDGIATDPRGIALDEDGIRALQCAGIYDKIYSDIGQCMGIFNFIAGVHDDLYHPPITRMDYSTSEGGTGHVGFICHKQPHLEKHIRSSFVNNISCDLRQGCVMTGISEDIEWVYVTYNDKSGTERKIRGKFLVGADGKTGFTRKMYLEPKGILMQQTSHTSYEETWVAINWHISLPTPDTHPNFPLWEKGYSPEDAFDLFFPINFRFLCNPARPAVCGRFGTPAERLWRFEFFVRPGEKGEEMARPEKLRDIVYPYITHPGSRYGLKEDIIYPTDCIETLRSRPFYFAARSCNRWAEGRVILTGDAAHVFPPFGGQGLASGFRDSGALAWRLKIACQNGYHMYESLFRGWYQERKQQLDRSLAATVRNGEYVTEVNQIKIWIRNTYLWLVQLVPSWRRQLEQGPRSLGMCQYDFEPGMHFLPERRGGLLLPQVYCSPLNGESQGVIAFTDDEIFAPRKHGLFQLIAIADNARSLAAVEADLESISAASTEFVSIPETTVIVLDTHAQPVLFATSSYQAVRVATAEEFAASPLCANRPPPQYYDELRIAKELPGAKYIIVRPDWFVFAACGTKDELAEALSQIKLTLTEEAEP